MNKACFTMADGELMVDYGALRVSEGPVAPVAFGQPTTADGRMVTATFEKNPEHRRADAADKVYLAAFNAVSGEAVLSVPAYRRMRRVELLLPEEWADQEVYLYGFVQDAAGRTSMSVYLGAPVREAEEEPQALLSFPPPEVVEDQSAEALRPTAPEAVQAAPEVTASAASPQSSLLSDDGGLGAMP